MSVWCEIDAVFVGAGKLSEAEVETLQWFSSEPHKPFISTRDGETTVNYNARDCGIDDDDEVTAWFAGIATRCETAELIGNRGSYLGESDRYRMLRLRKRGGVIERAETVWRVHPA